MSAQYINKTALVTGASDGIGAAIAVELAGRGAHVILLARRNDCLLEVADKISREGGSATPLPCDLTDYASVATVISEIMENFKGIDLLVNNAGRELIAPLSTLKPQKSLDLMEINVVSMIEMTRGCLKILKKNSSVVNMASVVGMVGGAGLSVYSASKGAVIALTKSLAKELACRKIRVNAVAPGFVKTEMMQRLFKNFSPDQVKALETEHLLGFGTPEDVARGVAFLGSDDAAWITGHVLVIDGGFSI